MKGVRLCCVFVIMVLAPAQGEEEEQLELLTEMAGYEEEQELLGCFRCDLGFWDACYTTKTNCSIGEHCYTGRGKAADLLDVKTLGCVKAEECDVVTAVELYDNKTIFVMTKHCCNTPFCNAAHNQTINTLSYLTPTLLTVWHLVHGLTGSQ
ncbi:sperm acrosome membrane-associated protein 4-like [Thalassophryne amazonica]|uniref:sperm acrosome membrane-associated protein 4-like n=1 Tax=Thalassophryne amazonica TaxID=390379 RepID=UPI001471D9C4|nr:sperm acrosome membrane-associated protein 4-like [Thalassophryne amazonica]